MPNQFINSHYSEGDQLLQAAQKELHRSVEDTVPYMICSNARQSIIRHLNGYLLDRGVDPGSSFTIQQLFTTCMELDPNFKSLDMDQLFCKNESNDNHFCTDIKKVEDCVRIASTVSALVRADNWPLSKPVK